VAVSLAFLRALDAAEANKFNVVWVQKFESVAVEGPDSSPVTQDLCVEIRATALAASGTLSAKESSTSLCEVFLFHSQGTEDHGPEQAVANLYNPDGSVGGGRRLKKGP